MGFNSKNWNSTTLTTSDLNRIEKGIKDSHDTLDLLGEEVSALQLRQISNQSDIKTLLKDTPTLAATLNEIENLLNKDNKVLETIRDINQLVTKQELDARLFGWIKITDIKQDGNSIYDGDSIINIKSKPIDTSLDINSNNAISNKAVTKALNNLNLTGNIPTKLAELSQDSLHQTVTASEKSKWNSILETLDNIILTETDPTVPDWAKQKTKPYYDYAEIINTPAIPTNADFTLAGLKEKSYNSLTDKPIIPTKTSQLTNDSNFATTSQIPDTSGFVPNTRTINNKALSSNISLSNKDVGALPDYTISILHQTAGNPRQVKFLSVNYSSYTTESSAYLKLGAMSCHGNGTSYQFLEDIIIGVAYNPTTDVVTPKCEVYKYVQIASGTVDDLATYYGDIYYVIDSTNKIIDFYILCGQYASSQFTPFTKIGSTTTSGITQYSGTATYYSSGTKVWATGNGTTYARLSDLSNYLPLSGGTIKGTSGDTPFTVQSASQSTYIGFKNSSGGILGYLGVNNNKRPVFYDSTDRELALKSDIPDLSSYVTKDSSNIINNVAGMYGRLFGDDTRSVNGEPSTYQSQSLSKSLGIEFKTASTISAPNSNEKGFVILQTITPWGDTSGGLPSQLSYGNGLAYRTASSSSAWNSWRSIIDSTGGTISGTLTITGTLVV